VAGMTFTIDQKLTFSAAVLISSGPKFKFQSDQQDTTNSGVKRWECIVSVVGISDNGMPPGNDNLSVGINAEHDPFTGLSQGALVTFDNLRVGHSTAEIKEKGGRTRVAGGKPWFTANGIRAASSATQAADAVSKHFGSKAEVAS
jgi:hypothetical protein